jgi:hypothetical protein
MRHFTIVLLSIVIAAGGLLQGGHHVVAQETTPVPGADDGSGGVTVELLGGDTTNQLPTTPATVYLARITLEPGASLPAEAEDPSIALIVIESGAVAITMDASIVVQHPAVDGEPGTESSEEVPAGQPFMMNAGDSALFPPNVGGELRNGGRRVTVLLAVLIGPNSGGMVTGAR